MLDSPVYEWIKALHVISVISWMAGMLYLPRLFVYHCETTPGTAESERFKVMERKLLKIIINPAMIATWVFGILMIAARPEMFDGAIWLHLKLTLVLALSGLHGWFVRMQRAFAEDRNTRPQRFYRMVNETPAVIMILVVILVIVKPV